MKTIKKLTLGLAVAVLTLTSCGKPDRCDTPVDRCEAVEGVTYENGLPYPTDCLPEPGPIVIMDTII